MWYQLCLSLVCSFWADLTQGKASPSLSMFRNTLDALPGKCTYISSRNTGSFYKIFVAWPSCWLLPSDMRRNRSFRSVCIMHQPWYLQVHINRCLIILWLTRTVEDAGGGGTYLLHEPRSIWHVVPAHTSDDSLITQRLMEMMAAPLSGQSSLPSSSFLLLLIGHLKWIKNPRTNKITRLDMQGRFLTPGPPGKSPSPGFENQAKVS